MTALCAARRRVVLTPHNDLHQARCCGNHYSTSIGAVLEHIAWQEIDRNRFPGSRQESGQMAITEDAL